MARIRKDRKKQPGWKGTMVTQCGCTDQQLIGEFMASNLTFEQLTGVVTSNMRTGINALRQRHTLRLQHVIKDGVRCENAIIRRKQVWD